MTLQGALPVAIEAIGRIAPAAIAIGGLWLAETRWPWRPAQRRHAAANLGLGGVSFLAVLLLPLASMTAASQWAASQGFGRLHLVALPGWMEVSLSVLALDLALYLQHRALHAGPLWRLHRVHHTDPMLDFTSGLRFHPLEAGASALYKSLVVVLLGAPALAVAISVSLTLVASLFTHANIRLPPGLERVLGAIVITPSLHRIHHSTWGSESQRNFGSVLSVWDRCFGSALASAAQGEELLLGVDGQPAQTGLNEMLADPFRNRTVAGSPLT